MSLQFEYVFTVKVEVAAPIEVGDTYTGKRRVIPITGGTFEGPLLNGIILPGGADYQTIRNDNVTVAMAHYTLQTDDGANIYVQNRGLRHGPKEIIDKIIRGEEVPKDSYYFKTAPIFEVSDPKYDFLNRNIFVGVGERYPTYVQIKYYNIL